ncbi:MAG: hypothetical protein QOH41_1364 [Blastocatellia bacterium]|jgi:hypothetical protein|nr:hypothetical protein [Blastocatellia bacterium]
MARSSVVSVYVVQGESEQARADLVARILKRSYNCASADTIQMESHFG